MNNGNFSPGMVLFIGILCIPFGLGFGMSGELIAVILIALVIGACDR